MRTTALAILGLTRLVVALTAEDPSYRGGYHPTRWIGMIDDPWILALR